MGHAFQTFEYSLNDKYLNSVSYSRKIFLHFSGSVSFNMPWQVSVRCRCTTSWLRSWLRWIVTKTGMLKCSSQTLLSLGYLLKYNKHVQSQYYGLSLTEMSDLLWLLRSIQHCRKAIACWLDTFSMSLDVGVTHFRTARTIWKPTVNLESEAQLWAFGAVVRRYWS